MDIRNIILAYKNKTRHHIDSPIFKKNHNKKDNSNRTMSRVLSTYYKYLKKLFYQKLFLNLQIILYLCNECLDTYTLPDKQYKLSTFYY